MPRRQDELSLLEGTAEYSWRIDPETGETEYVDKYGRTKEEILAEYQERANRLNAVSGVYQRANRIISRDSELTVSVVNDPNMDTNAQSDGRNITFNANLINDFDKDNILHLHGLNFHELSHVLFSPRAGSNLIQYVKQNDYNRAVSLLEEGRAEALMTAKYPNTRLFLEASSIEYLVNNPNVDIADYFPHLTGRTYLPIELRQAVADKFIAKYGRDLATTIHSLIHEYRTLVFPRDFDKAKELIARMAEIVGTDSNPKRKIETPIHVHNSMKQGRPQGKAEQERLQDKIKGKGEPIENMGGNPSDKREGNEGNKPNAGTRGEYNGGDREITDTERNIAKTINERMAEIKDNEHVKQTINETRRAILGSDETRSIISNASYQEVTPSPTSINLARRFGQELERIVRNNEPKWDKFNSRGKLNITRTMNPDVNAIRTHFDIWDTGNPNTDIEAVVLMDNSSSMGGLMKYVTESAWVMKRGIENINGNVTLFTFNHESKKVYDKSEKAKANSMRYVYASGGTNPIRAMIETERVLTMSKRSIKVAFIVTDGEWNMSDECDSIIKSMNDKGILTCVVFIGNYEYYKSMIEGARQTDDMGQHYRDQLKSLRHNAQAFHAVATSKDMLNVAQSLVKSTLNTNKAVAV